MRDNKVRLSTDVLEKAALIAAEWGLKNSRAAVEAVFRRYADEYLYGRRPLDESSRPERTHDISPTATWTPPVSLELAGTGGSCEALNALDELLGA